MEDNSTNPLGFKYIFKTAFTIFQRIFLPSLAGLTVLMAVITIITLFLFPIVFKVSLTEFSNMVTDSPEEFQIFINTGNFALNSFLISVLISCLLAPMSAGILQSCKLAFEKNPIPLKTVFSYYSSVHTKRIITFTIAFKSIVELIISLSVYLGLGSLSVSISLLLSILTIFCIPMIIFENLSVRKAFQTSFRTVVPYMITIFLFLLLGGLVAVSGILLFGIGIVITFPFWYAMLFTLYFALRGVKGNLVF